MTKRPFWTSFLVMLYLLAVLLPANTVSAADQAEPCAQAGVQSASIAAVAVPVADQPVKISKEEVDHAAFVANWRNRYTDAEEVYAIFGNLLALSGGESGVSIDWQKVFTELNEKFEKAIPAANLNDQNLYSYDDILHTAFEVTLTIPEVAHLVPTVWREMANSIDPDSAYYSFLGDSASKVSASAWRYSQAARMIALSSDVLARAHDCAQKNPAFAQAFDQLNGKKLNASITDDAMTILEKNLDIDFPTELRGRINRDGTITISLDELKNMTKVELDKIHTSIDEMQGTLVEIDEQQKVIVDYIKNEELKAKYQELAKKKAAEEQLKLDAAKASITILTTIMGQIDPKVAKDLGVIANSSLQVGMAINSWLKAVSGLKGLDKVASLSTVVMTGNVLGAVMNVVALFGDDKPTPEQMILEEIGKLRQQVDKLRTEMHGRFDRIDAGLNAIYTSMHDRFNQIDVQLGKINGNILDVQQSLFSLDLKLSHIERNNFELINAVGRRDFLNAVYAGLGYEDRTGLQMAYEPDFIDFESIFHTWGTVHAYDPGNAGPTQRDFRDAKVFEELNKYPLDLNLNYLNGWLIAHGLPALTDKYLASSRDWLFASRAYTQLGMEWPQHMRRVDSNQQETLDKVGYEIDAAIRNISTQQTANGPTGNSLLFSSVITYYQDKLDRLDSAIQPVEASFVNELQSSWLQRAEPFNLYGGTKQPLTYITPEISTLTCGNDPAHGPRQLSSNLKALIPNFDLYNLADYLRVGKFAGCLTDEWQNLEMYSQDDPERPNDPPTYYWGGQHKAILTIYFDSVPILRQTIDEGDTIMNFYQPDTWTKDNWTFAGGYKEKFDALTTADSPTPEMAAQEAALFNTVTDKVETALAGYQKELYKRVIHEVTAGSLKDMATEAGGGMALLNAFTTLGLPRALEDDEFLRALLYGDQRLVDHNTIVQSYALSVTQPISGTSLLVNPRLAIRQTAGERTAAFSEIIDEYLDAITQETHAEVADYIAGTRLALDLTTRIVQLIPPEPDEEAIAGLQVSSNGPTLLGNATAFTAGVTAGTNVSFAWDFGDGKVDVGATATHIYAEAGVYTVMSTASNSVSQATAEMQVVVEPLASGQTTKQVHLPLVQR